MAWCSQVHGPYKWAIHPLPERMFPHSLALADFNGNSMLDIFVAEMGLKHRNPNPKILIYQNQGDMQFEEYLVAEGYPMHEAKVGNFGNTEKPSIVGKAFKGSREREVHLWLNRT